MFAGLRKTPLRQYPGRCAAVIRTFSSKSSQSKNESNNKVVWGPFAAFRDSVPRQQRMAAERVGRSWSAVELRRKSYDDLHKLWYVLYKERNMLLTEQQISRRKRLQFPQPERMKKVRKSMGAIKQVLGERKRGHLAYLVEQKKLDDVNPATNDKMDESA